jgi:5-methyltetrahydrofolate--homocysteine methyltransferase
MPDLTRLYDSILNGDHKAAIAVTREAIDAGVDALEIVTRYMVPAMDEVGRRFECEDYFSSCGPCWRKRAPNPPAAW